MANIAGLYIQMSDFQVVVSWSQHFQNDITVQAQDKAAGRGYRTQSSSEFCTMTATTKQDSFLITT